MKKDFYIGYMPKAPKSIVRFVLAFVLTLFILMGGISYFLASSHNHVNNGTFEYGELTELKGVIKVKPVPHIIVLANDSSSIRKNIMLIDFGKSGAKSSIEKMESKIGQDINTMEVRIRGTLIYQDGFTLLELTEKENALLDYTPLGNGGKYLRYLTINVPSQNQTFTGEIIDPKCYFGSMKPGQGKPHLSCAALCISGGIPPVLVVQTEQKTAEYYILKGENGEEVNEEILDFISGPIQIEGQVIYTNEWKVLHIDPKNIKRLN